jgi:NAD(P)H-flavin reductase
VQNLVFRVSRGAPMPYRAGHYVDLFPPAASGLVMKRPYSIASAYDPAPPQAFEFAITRVDEGPTSVALHDLGVGAEIDLEGPHGSFTREAGAPEPSLFIATGTGLAPLRAMLQEELRRASGPSLTLLFGARTEADLLWHDELAAMAKEHPRLRYEPTLTRASRSWPGRRGRVQTHLADVLSSDHVAYVCGLPEMVEDVKDALSALGLPRRAVRFEEYV